MRVLASVVLAAGAAIALALIGCSTGGTITVGNEAGVSAVEAGPGQNMDTEGAEDMLTDDERAVFACYEAFEQAMIDKNIDALRSLVAEGTTFTHMSGKTQTADEFFGEIADGTLNYYAYQLHDPVVTVVGDTATLTGSTTLEARVYGVSGTWTLPTNAHFVRIDGHWLCCN